MRLTPVAFGSSLAAVLALAACGGAPEDSSDNSSALSSDAASASTKPLSSAGAANYTVASVTGGDYCMDIPPSTFGQKGDLVAIDFEKSSVILRHADFDGWQFFSGEHVERGLGITDTSVGTYARNSFLLNDFETVGTVTTEGTPYYTVNIVRSGTTITLTTTTSGTEDVVCTLTKNAK